jgi:hypothetical protein
MGEASSTVTIKRRRGGHVLIDSPRRGLAGDGEQRNQQHNAQQKLSANSNGSVRCA